LLHHGNYLLKSTDEKNTFIMEGVEIELQHPIH
jgi:hypothetical protein